MSNKIEEKIFPFSWEGWDIQDTMIFTFYDVEFSEDFGVFKKGKYSNITVLYDKGIIEGYDLQGNVTHKQEFKCIPV